TPSFKRRGQEAGLRFPDPKEIVLDGLNARIKLPRLGWVRLRMSRRVEGALRNVTITREGEKWFASIQAKQHETVAALGVAPTLGVDLGVVVIAATSDGQLVAPLRALAKHQRRVKYQQRALAKKKRNSSNFCKAVR